MYKHTSPLLLYNKDTRVLKPREMNARIYIQCRGELASNTVDSSRDRVHLASRRKKRMRASARLITLEPAEP